MHFCWLLFVTYAYLSISYTEVTVSFSFFCFSMLVNWGEWLYPPSHSHTLLVSCFFTTLYYSMSTYYLLTKFLLSSPGEFFESIYIYMKKVKDIIIWSNKQELKRKTFWETSFYNKICKATKMAEAVKVIVTNEYKREKS